MNKKKTIISFIERASIIHNNKYNYSESVYNGSNKLISIICRIHGAFSQLASSHLAGRGCRKCADDARTKTTSQFIMDAISIFGEKYDYSNVIYKNAYKKIKIICVKHGEFIQSPHDHLSGCGCPKCKADIIGNTLRKSVETFIYQAEIVHDNKYIYSKALYINNNTKIIIICPIHNEFNQTPDNHLSGAGCPKCVSSISKIEIKWLDYLKIPQEYRHKTLKINNKNIFVDAYDPTTNTIYEFYGNFWHGNPRTHKSEHLNLLNKKTFGELFQETLMREKNIKNAGFNVINIWEDEFKIILKTIASH